MNLSRSLLSISVAAIAVVGAYKCVGFDDAEINADDAPVKGVSMNPADKAGDLIAVEVLGTVQVAASGVVAAGDSLVSAIGGGVKKAPADPSNVFAKALTSAADGELVEILIR